MTQALIINHPNLVHYDASYVLGREGWRADQKSAHLDFSSGGRPYLQALNLCLNYFSLPNVPPKFTTKKCTTQVPQVAGPGDHQEAAAGAPPPTFHQQMPVVGYGQRWAAYSQLKTSSYIHSLRGHLRLGCGFALKRPIHKRRYCFSFLSPASLYEL